MDLSPSHLHSLLYGYDDFARYSPNSIHPADTPILRVKIIPFDIGVLIRSADPAEEVFHVELFALKAPPRAELWSTKAWNESLTRRWQHRPPQQYEVPIPLHSQIIQFQRELIYLLVGRGIKPADARSAAECLMRGDDEQVEDILSFLQFLPTYHTKLKALREALAAETAKLE